MRYLLLAVYLIPAWIIGRFGGIGDLRIYFEAVHNAFSKNYSQIYVDSVSPYFYGPIFLIVYFPLALIPTYQGAIIASLLWHTLAYVLFWYFLFKLYPALLEKKTFWAWFVVWIVTINPVHCNFQAQNVQLPIAALLIGAHYSISRKTNAGEWLGGALISLAAAIKVFPIFLMAFYFLHGRKRVILGMAAGLVLSLGLPFLVFGIDPSIELYRGFYRTLLLYPQKNRLEAELGIHSLPTLIASWLYPFVSASVRTGTIVIVQLSISTLFFVWFLRNRKELTDTWSTHSWALAMALMVFLNPSSRHDYFLFYIPAFASAMQLWTEGVFSRVSKAGTLCAIALIAFTTSFILGRSLNDYLESFRVPVIGMAFLLLVLSQNFRSSGEILPTGK